MLTLVKLTNAEYVLSGVASGLEDYYMGIGESPGVWHGRWAKGLGLEGVVEAEHLRAVVDGRDPDKGDDLLAGNRERTVRAFDLTLSAPKSVSLLIAFGPPEVAAIASQAHVEAAGLAMDLMESKAALARIQIEGVRTRVSTSGLAIATFVHRVSRDGDPDLHTHNVVPNVVQRPDGSHCALDANPLHVWAKATGSVYAEQLRRILTQRLGVEWGPDRNGTREMLGFSREQLRAFSKRTVAIESYLERNGDQYQSPAARMRADDFASVATRRSKDPGFTPELLRQRWETEAKEIGLGDPEVVRTLVCDRPVSLPELDPEDVFARLVDAEVGLCAHDSRFGEAHVVEAVAAMGAGRWDVGRITELAGQFLSSNHVVRLMETEARPAQRRPPQWSTVAHRALEDRVLSHLGALVARAAEPIDASKVRAAIAAEGRLGRDQARAVRELCGPGPALRSLISPAGFGKTTAVHAGAVAAAAEGRPVIGVATTNQAVAELAGAGIPSMTIARLGMEMADGHGLATDTVVILDEASQTSTADAEVVLGAVAATPGAQLWALGDVRQAQAVRAGGLAAEIDRLGREGAIPAPALTENRRQLDAKEREALARYRAGDAAASQAIRAGQGWEHSLATPADTRSALAAAAVADADSHGPGAVAVLAVSHADCEDLADRIRAIRTRRGELGGRTMSGPGWGAEPRRYAGGDRVLLHARVGRGVDRLDNGTEVRVMWVGTEGLAVRTDEGREAVLARAFVEGQRRDGTPNLSHSWARTVDGCQGGTWSQVHLLGNAALDNFKAYVGQSRSQLPTQTWNVSPVIGIDYGGALADRRGPDEVVLAAMQRAPLKTFAFDDDPWVTDRRLSAELADHREVIATRPPDRSWELKRAREELTQVGYELKGAHGFFAGATERLDAIGAVARLRRDGRQAHSRASAEVERASEELECCQQKMVEARQQVSVLERAISRRADWDRQHGWRLAEVARIQSELDRHWAGATLGAVHQGEPLAFGIDRLRAARATYARELRRLDDALPPDRRWEAGQARRDLEEAKVSLTGARQMLADAESDDAGAHQRHWGRRDRTRMAETSARVERARDQLRQATERVTSCGHALAKEQRAVAARETAVDATAPERAVLESKVAELDQALDATRPERVLAMARGEVPEHLHKALGPAPDSQGGQAVWCGLASEIEAQRDRPGQGHSPERTELPWWARTLAPANWTRSLSGVTGTERAIELVKIGVDQDPAPARAEVGADPGVWVAHLDQARAHVADRSQRLERAAMEIDF